MRADVGICFGVAAIVACAEMGPPPGGPVDKTPATVVSVSPESLATLVPPDARLRFTFSEKIDRATFARALRLVPDVELAKPRVDGSVAEVRPAGVWPDSQVIVWFLETSLKDRHGVPLPTAISGAFTRAAELPPGAVTGSARWESTEREKALPAIAELFRMPAAGDRRRTLWRRDQVDQDRHFRLEFLELGDGPFELEVYLDKNANGKRDERELTARLDSLFLPDSLRTLDVGSLVLLDLEGPVDTWLCSNPSQDSVKIIAYGISLLDDTTRTAPLDSTGCSARPLSFVPGALRLGLFRDLDADGRFGADSLGISEPYVASREFTVLVATPDTFVVDAAWERHAWAELDSLEGAPPRRLRSGSAVQEES